MDMRRQANDYGPTEAPAPVAAINRGGRGGGLLWKIVAAIVIAVGLAVLISYGARALSTVRADSAIKGKQYQAVFLTNGQVYFGKLSHTSAGYVQLTDIYYLQVQQTVQPGTTATANNNNQQVSLAKLGGELHGPEDTMYVARDQMLFWENLKNDGKVAQAITDYKSKNK